MYLLTPLIIPLVRLALSLLIINMWHMCRFVRIHLEWDMPWSVLSISLYIYIYIYPWIIMKNPLWTKIKSLENDDFGASTHPNALNLIIFVCKFNLVCGRGMSCEHNCFYQTHLPSLLGNQIRVWSPGP